MFSRAKQQLLEKIGKANPTEDEKVKETHDVFVALEKRYGALNSILGNYIKVGRVLE
jgi:hypothetical protein